MGIIPFEGIHPKIDPSVFVADGAWIIGDVEIGADSSVWFGCVIRGDVCRIRIGARTSIQDGTIIHVTRDTHPSIVGSNVTVGHRAVIHGCTVGDGALIGMGAVVLDAAVIGEGALVGAGALVTPGTDVPPHHMALGVPAKVVRELNEEERAMVASGADSYLSYVERYRAHGYEGQKS